MLNGIPHLAQQAGETSSNSNTTLLFSCHCDLRRRRLRAALILKNPRVSQAAE